MVMRVGESEVALIVDEYLSANCFSQTRATFRMEASSLFAASPLNQVSNTCSNLGKILDHYISMKEQKLIFDQERLALIQEKNRVRKLLLDMQNALSSYNAFQRPIPMNVPVTNATSATFPQPRFCNKTPSGVYAGTTTSNVLPQQQQQPRFTVNVCDKKRKNTQTMDDPTAAKRPRVRLLGKRNQVQGRNTLPQTTTQSFVANSATTGPGVPNNSPILQARLVTATNQSFRAYTYGSTSSDNSPATTCNGVISTTTVMADSGLPKKESFLPSPMNSDTDTKDKRENSIPIEVSIPHKETAEDHSQSFVANSAATRPEVPNNSPILEARLVTATNQSFHAYTYGSPSSDNSPTTTCNGVISTTRVMADSGLPKKESLLPSPMNSDTHTKDKRENSIPIEVSILHKETTEDHSQSFVANSAATLPEVPNNSPILEARLVTATDQSSHAYTYGSPSSDNSPATTCNEVISTTGVMADSAQQMEESLRPSPMNLDDDSKDKRENSIPNEVPILHKETVEDHSHIGFSDADMEYWANFDFSGFETDYDFLKDIGIMDAGLFDRA